ncbi:winged helix-turn-helix transcriptional regulator [Streptomyces yokosukanensis]
MLHPDTSADIARVSEALAMLTPRWNVRILSALAGQPLRYQEIVHEVPWLQSGQLSPKLRQLCEAGLVQRDEHSSRHVTYGHTDRAAELMTVLRLVATWAERYLGKPEQPLSAIEQIEDSLALLSGRHTAAILWVLKIRGEAGGRTLARLVMPGNEVTSVYPPLRQLVADALVDTDGMGQPYRLSASGAGLGPVLGALSAWAAGAPLPQGAQHPVWGRFKAAPAPQRWVSNQSPSQLPAPVTVPPPNRTVHAPSLAWQSGDLFSHATPPRPQALTAGGPRR